MDHRYKEAQKRVKAKKEFYGHLSAYIAVGIFFFIMNLVTLGEEPKIWFFYPMLCWGVGLLIHYFSVFGIPGVGVLSREWEEREIAKELQKYNPLPNHNHSYEDPDLEDPLELEIDPKDQSEIKEPSREYDESDFV